MKITKNELKKLIAENLKKSKDFKKLNEKFYPTSVRKLGKDDDNRGNTVSHIAGGLLAPSSIYELDPRVYPFADPKHEDHEEMKKRFEADPSLFKNYGSDAEIKTMYYGKKDEPKTHRPKIIRSDLQGIEGLKFPEGMSDIEANREIGRQSKDEFAPFGEGGAQFDSSAASQRGPSKVKRQSDAIMKIDEMQIGLQEKIVQLQSAKKPDADKISYLQQLYFDLDEVKTTLASIKI